MKYAFCALIFLVAACGIPERETEAAVVAATDTLVRPETGTWVYFSQNTFINSSFGNGMNVPNVKRKLTAAERQLLDSVVAGYFNPPPDPNGSPKLGCFRPKHGIEAISSSAVSTINICFECNSTRSSDAGLYHVPLAAWKVFFKRLGIPVGTGYPEFFAKAKSDSVFRAQNGTFRF